MVGRSSPASSASTRLPEVAGLAHDQAGRFRSTDFINVCLPVEASDDARRASTARALVGLLVIAIIDARPLDAAHGGFQPEDRACSLRGVGHLGEASSSADM